MPLKQKLDITLYDFQRRLSRQEIQIPDWQRGDIWSQKKKREFEKTIISKSRTKDHLGGCVVIYETEENPGVVKLNDGVQRGCTSMAFFNHLCEINGKDGAEDIFSRVQLTLQHFVYKDEEEAKVEFVNLNEGTSLTPYERTVTILSSLKPYKLWDTGLLSPIHHVVEQAVGRMGIKESRTRHTEHKHLRDDLALFLRYVCGDKHDSNYKASRVVNGVDFSNAKKKQDLIESRLVRELIPLGLEGAKDKLKSFRTFVENETALLEEIWSEIEKNSWEDHKESLTPATFRWLLCLSVYRKNKNIQRQDYRNFVKSLLERSQGGSQIPGKNGGRGTLALRLSDLTILGTIQDAIDVFADQAVRGSKKRCRAKINQIKSGRHNAHIKPFSRYGEGRTTTKPGIDNLSQGTQCYESELFKV